MGGSSDRQSSEDEEEDAVVSLRSWLGRSVRLAQVYALDPSSLRLLPQTDTSVLSALSLPTVILFPLNFVPVVGILISSAVKALGTARYLHQPYYLSKKMTQDQIDVFIEERKWDYLAFGFTSALLEALPFVGMLFSVSNVSPFSSHQLAFCLSCATH